MKAAVIVFPGSNCDRDAKTALESVTEKPVTMIWHTDNEFPKLDLIVIPGGFSYGDYLRSGSMAAHSPVMRNVKDASDRGIPVLGICNGFQILTECGILPGVLMRNAHLRFICRYVHLKIEHSQSVFTTKYLEGQVIKIPIAHNEGNYFADSHTLNQLEDEQLIAMRYATPKGIVTEESNPNGAARNIAGIFNKTKNVLGMMPHPERVVDSNHGGTDGRALFESLAESFS